MSYQAFVFVNLNNGFRCKLTHSGLFENGHFLLLLLILAFVYLVCSFFCKAASRNMQDNGHPLI